MIEVYAAEVPMDRDLSFFDPLMALLPQDRRDRIRRFVHREDSLRGLTGDWLARKIISRRLRIPLSTIRFTCDEYGKPHLYLDALFFNISHSGKWVAAAAGTSPLGVDIEQIKPLDLSVAESVFSPAEMSALQALPPGERLAFFYRLWTTKESLIKAIGRGLSLPLTEYTVQTDGNDITVSGPLSSAWHFRQYCLGNDYILTACSTEKHFSEEVALEELHFPLSVD